MKWLRWRWKCWRFHHFVWRAYVDWYDVPIDANRYRWERLNNRWREMVEAGPRG